MPSNTRTWSRREITATVGNIQAAQTHLLKVVNIYIDEHPEIAGPLELASESLEEVINMIKRVRGMI